MPHTCIGALSHYYQSLADYIVSEQAVRIVEFTAAGTAVYRSAWKPLKPSAVANLHRHRHACDRHEVPENRSLPVCAPDAAMPVSAGRQTPLAGAG